MGTTKKSTELEKTVNELEKQKLLKEKERISQLLPHLYGFKHYKWSREFFESRNRMNFLCAGNQLSKSSTQIRKCIHWATSPKMWPKLWPTKPNTFWYLYPSKEVATIEVTQKWVKEFLPRGDMKDHAQYGWELEKRDRWVWAIHFRTGVSIFFKTYRQDPQMLQAGTSWAIFSDEELNWELFPEVSRRIAATRGYFHLVFTATLGQVELKDIIEGKGKREAFPDAAKWQISMYDCMVYEDGTPSPWTKERIEEEIKSIGDPREVERRIHGKFVLSSGLKYPGFLQDRNLKEPLPLETYKSWFIYAGVDIGSGSDASSDNPIGHPAAITFIAVRPDFKYGRVFRGWIGDDVETSAGDVYNKYADMSEDLNVSQQFYDYASKDFLIISQRAGASFEPAEKARDAGELALNTLFKNGMLDVDDIPELQPLVRELVSLTKQKKRGDDYSDSLRYACVRIPWNFIAIREAVAAALSKLATPGHPVKTGIELERDERRKMLQSNNSLNELYEEEIAAWNELLET